MPKIASLHHAPLVQTARVLICGATTNSRLINVIRRERERERDTKAFSGFLTCNTRTNYLPKLL